MGYTWGLGGSRDAAGGHNRREKEQILDCRPRCPSPAIEGIQTPLLVGCLQLLTAVHGLGALQGSCFFMHRLGTARRSALAPKGEGKMEEMWFGAINALPSVPACTQWLVSASQGQQEHCCDFPRHVEEKIRTFLPRNSSALAAERSKSSTCSYSTLRSRATPQEPEVYETSQRFWTVSARICSSVLAKQRLPRAEPLPRTPPPSFHRFIAPQSLKPFICYHGFYQRSLSAVTGKANTLPGRLSPGGPER